MPDPEANQRAFPQSRDQMPGLGFPLAGHCPGSSRRPAGRVITSVHGAFLERLISGMERKIFLMVDGHPAHKAKLVSGFVMDNAAASELFFPPPHVPELNPDELARGHIKTRIAKTAVQSWDEPKAMVDRVMRRLQKMLDIVAGFFHAPTCVYARE